MAHLEESVWLCFIKQICIAKLRRLLSVMEKYKGFKAYLSSASVNKNTPSASWVQQSIICLGKQTIYNPTYPKTNLQVVEKQV